MNTLKENLSILLISDRDTDTQSMTRHLGRHMRMPWQLIRCTNIREADYQIAQADIIILDLELIGLSSPRQIFKEVGDRACEVPIIAITSIEEGENGLSTYVMEQGAADIIVRGQFGHLIDAIEFALIRQKINVDHRKMTDAALAESESQVTALRGMKTQSDWDAVESKKTQIDDQEKGKQILRMFMGDYSVDH